MRDEERESGREEECIASITNKRNDSLIKYSFYCTDDEDLLTSYIHYNDDMNDIKVRLCFSLVTV